jgi:large subunit ribosomal protein L31
LHIAQKALSLPSNWKENSAIMKKNIHPESYRLVVFKDFSADEAFMTRSCVQTRDSIVWEDGKEYPLVKLEISAYSHPFFTGKMKFVDTAGRIDKFNKKFSQTKFANKTNE